MGETLKADGKMFLSLLLSEGHLVPAGLFLVVFGLV